MNGAKLLWRSVSTASPPRSTRTVAREAGGAAPGPAGRSTAECVRHAAMFFGRPDFDLESAAASRFALVPSGPMLSGLRRDYQAMAGMVFDTVPAFDLVMPSSTPLESRLRVSS